MADKSMFSIEVETATFDAFKHNFDDYHSKLNATLGIWKQISAEINAAQGRGQGIRAWRQGRRIIAGLSASHSVERQRLKHHSHRHGHVHCNGHSELRGRRRRRWWRRDATIQAAQGSSRQRPTKCSAT